MIYFFIYPPNPPYKAAYQHEFVVIAEGLKELGVDYYSNIDYWKPSLKEDFLFKANSKINHTDCEIVITTSQWRIYGDELPENLFSGTKERINIFTDMHEGNPTCSWEEPFREFNFILKGQFNYRCKYPSNFVPWAFGLSNRIIVATHNTNSFVERSKCILSNQRVKHQVRAIVLEKFLPEITKVFEVNSTIDSFELNQGFDQSYDALHWYQTGCRHYHSYYDRLKQSQACSTFGGKILRNWPIDQVKPQNRFHKILNRLDRRHKRIIQWDSWRFWESLAAGCLTFHVDFDLYGVKLPVMPQNWSDYVGVDLDNVDYCIEKLLQHPEELEKIAANGRKWALEHYSPKAVAIRFLETIGYKA